MLPWIKYFWSHVRWFLNKFHWWLRHSWKLAIHPTCDQNIVMNDNPYFIQYIHVILGLKLIHVTKSGPWWASIMHYEMFQWFHSLRTTLRKTANILRWWTSTLCGPTRGTVVASYLIQCVHSYVKACKHVKLFVKCSGSENTSALQSNF